MVILGSRAMIQNYRFPENTAFRDCKYHELADFTALLFLKDRFGTRRETTSSALRLVGCSTSSDK